MRHFLLCLTPFLAIGSLHAETCQNLNLINIIDMTARCDVADLRDAFAVIGTPSNRICTINRLPVVPNGIDCEIVVRPIGGSTGGGGRNYFEGLQYRFRPAANVTELKRELAITTTTKVPAFSPYELAFDPVDLGIPTNPAAMPLPQVELLLEPDPSGEHNRAAVELRQRDANGVEQVTRLLTQPFDTVVDTPCAEVGLSAQLCLRAHWQSSDNTASLIVELEADGRRDWVRVELGTHVAPPSMRIGHLGLVSETAEGSSELVELVHRIRCMTPAVGGINACTAATPSALAPVIPTDRYFAMPAGAPAGSTGYQWALQPGWMNFTEAWAYSTGSARIGINGAGTSNNVGNEFQLPEYGSWDFSPFAEQICTDRVNNGCSASAGASSPYVAYSAPQPAPRNYLFGMGDIDPVVQQPVAGQVFNTQAQSWETGTVLGWAGEPNDAVTAAALRGTQIFSSIKSRHSNTLSGNVGGVAGACPDCQVVATRSPGGTTTAPFVSATSYVLDWMIRSGVQIVSAREEEAASNAPCAVSYTVNESPLCEPLRLAQLRDVLVVAPAGSHLGSVDFPARDPLAVAVGGVDIQKRLWDERLYGYEDGDYNNGCPRDANSNQYGTRDCGSATGPELDFVAPARRILAAVPPGQNAGASYANSCGDLNFSTSSDGVGYCTGTSMAAPLVAAAAGLVRSLNPLLPRAAVYEVLKRSADGPGVPSNRGWGMPNAGTAVKLTLGRSGGLQVRNRLTPLFAMKTTGDRLYTVVPQLAVAAYNTTFAERPYRAYDAYDFVFGTGYFTPSLVGYSSAPAAEAPTVLPAGTGVPTAYRFPSLPYVVPRASMYVFSGRADMFGVPMQPLERLLSVASCDLRETTFVWTKHCTDQMREFSVDGIEGYLLKTCPAQFNGCQNPADPSIPQAVYLRYSSTHKSFALLLASQLSESQFSTYQPVYSGPPALPLGYAFKNADSDGDGLVDGMERVLQTNPASSDSDGDGLLDGTEYPMTGLQETGQDPLAFRVQ